MKKERSQMRQRLMPSTGNWTNLSLFDRNR
jgi:hypothetical protein